MTTAPGKRGLCNVAMILATKEAPSAAHWVTPSGQTRKRRLAFTEVEQCPYTAGYGRRDARGARAAAGWRRWRQVRVFRVNKAAHTRMQASAAALKPSSCTNAHATLIEQWRPRLPCTNARGHLSAAEKHEQQPQRAANCGHCDLGKGGI